MDAQISLVNRIKNSTSTNSSCSCPYLSTHLTFFTELMDEVSNMTIEGWLKLLNICDHDTELHSIRVADLAVKFARNVMFTKNSQDLIRCGSLLHDIGKLGISENILNKPGKLSDQDWVLMKKHPVFAFEILSPIQYLSDAIVIPYYHHEKWDGSGYPSGLSGEKIPLEARLVTIVDTWDALLSRRPYREPWKEEDAIEFMEQKSGQYFDPHLSSTFINMVTNNVLG